VSPTLDPGVGPFADLLGIRRTAMEAGRACVELDVGGPLLNPHGVVHGGAVYALVDYAMGGALTSLLEPGERCATLEIKINYLAAVSGGRLFAEARVVARTRGIAVLEAHVRAGDDRAMAHATGSFFVHGLA
jgi:acyl-CoA thioesterase